uniref:Uncharacterized protein n=1 Tax=Aegilops tauschii subsp. strangulata TaxID=200361 RepID=A0A453J6N5_AEGTS
MDAINLRGGSRITCPGKLLEELVSIWFPPTMLSAKVGSSVLHEPSGRPPPRCSGPWRRCSAPSETATP